MRLNRLGAILLVMTAACVGDPATSEDSSGDATEGGSLAVDACESPADDPGLGSLDQNLDGVLTIDDLEPGQAAMQAIWTDPSGTKTVWRRVVSTAEIWHGDANGDLTRYGVWLPFVDPEDMGELYTTAVFEGPVDGIAEPGSFMRLSSSWDIAFLERGGSNETEPGSVELVQVQGDLASGHVSAPSGPIEIVDYLANAPSGDVLCVQAMAFREIPAELTH